MRTVSLSLVVAALVAFAAAPAQAQDAEKARQLFQQGSKYYDLGQFDKAIEAWQQGYDQKPDPGFLYNIAQAYRQKQDATKAIFFYRGYLRNSPKAHNRAEVEQKIAALQKQAGDTGGTAPPANTTAPPPTNMTTAPPGSTLTVTPPPENPPSTTTVPAAFDAPPTTFAQASPPAPLESRNRPFDLYGGIGPTFWSSGVVNGTPKPSFVLTLAGGYSFGQPASRLRFRMGALTGYTFLAANEDSSSVTFLSVLLDPTLDIRLTQSGKWHLAFDIGFGIQMLAGLKPRSKLLATGEQLSVNGVQGMFETRIGAGVSYLVTPELAVFSSLAQMHSSKKQHFYGDIARVEWLFGGSYHF